MLLLSGGEVVKSKGKQILSSIVCFVCFIFDFERKPNVLKWIVLAYKSSNAKSETLPPASNKNNIPASFSFFSPPSDRDVVLMCVQSCGLLTVCWGCAGDWPVWGFCAWGSSCGAREEQGANKRARPCHRHKNLRKDKGNLTLTWSERIAQDTVWNFMPSGAFGTTQQCFKTPVLLKNLNCKFLNDIPTFGMQHLWLFWVTHNTNCWKKKETVFQNEINRYAVSYGEISMVNEH